MKISGWSRLKLIHYFDLDFKWLIFSDLKALLVASVYAGGAMKNQANQAVEATKPQAMDIARLVKRWWGGDAQAEKELQKRADQMVNSV